MSGEVARVREAVAKADDERRYAEAAESAMRALRLGYSPKVRERKRLWFGIDERKFTRWETHVLYEALQIIKRRHEERAAEYEQAAIATTEASQSAEMDATAELVEALRLTVEYVGTETLPAKPGWSWYDALVRHAPDVAERLANPPRRLSPVDTTEPHWCGRRPLVGTAWRAHEGPCEQSTSPGSGASA